MNKSLPTDCQFLHVARFGIMPRPGAEKWQCISGVLGEAGRLPSCVGHLRTPGAPVVLFGVPPLEVLGEALKLAEAARDETGRRKLRCDAGVLVAGVVSWPGNPALMDGADSFIERDIYSGWENDVIKFLKHVYGPSLRYVVRHEDESQLHLHFAALPSIAPNGALNWWFAHPGMRAKRAAAADGKPKPEQDQAYRDAIVHHQDEFYEQVSSQWGHARVGPERERVSRMEALAMQRIEEAKKIATKAWERKRAQIIAEAEAEGRRRHSVKIETMERLIADMARKYDALMGVVDKLKARNFELQSELHEFRNAPAL